MNQLEDMRLFVQTVDSGSFTAAADKLGLSKQFVSKRLLALEARLGVQLLVRTTRTLRSTNLGLRYYEQASKVIQEVDGIEDALAQQGGEARGRLRVSVPMTFGTMHLGPVIPRFLAAHPAVFLELELNDRTIDLVAEGYDAGVRIGVLPDSSLIGVQVALMEMATCCSPDYLQRRGRPQKPDDLAQHDCLPYGHKRHVEWTFTVAGKPKTVPISGRLCANNGEVIRDAACAGLGFAHLPTFIVGDALRDGRLVSVLDEFRPPLAGVYTVFPSHRQPSLVVRAFTDFMRSTFASPLRGGPVG
ncbi:MAG: LysR family transcriptional regulator [Dokdonella sp.]